MTPDELTEIEELSDSATPGDWFWDEHFGLFMFTLNSPQKPGQEQMVCDRSNGGVRIRGAGAKLPQAQNAEFIARSRSIVPALCKALRESWAREAEFKEKGDGD